VSNPPITFRPIVQTDVAALRRLLAQLGYELAEDEVAMRLAAVLAAPEHMLLAACSADRIIGLIHVYARPALDKPPEAIVQALVVEAACRGSGVGARLMAAAEEWATAHGFTSVALTSHVARERAHAFYAGLGYEIAATSHLLRRQLR
jgi:GNAT superfamily N-acetyltransferase